jgi:acyl-CoA hydrolase
MERIQKNPEYVDTVRFVKSEDLNHHGTLFAGRTAEWFVESGFIAAASLVNPKGVVCLKIHGMLFTKPVKPGAILNFRSKIVYTGKSSLVAYIKVLSKQNGDLLVDGFITFIYVDETTKAAAHGIEIVPESEEDKMLYQMALELKK